MRFDTELTEDLRALLAKEIMFTHEACQFLGITPQRLNQLVKLGKLIPLKASKAGSVFLRNDLEERKKELSSYKTEALPDNKIENLKIANDPTVIEEAINYFTIHTLFSYSFKKTEEFFNKNNIFFNLKEPLIKNSSIVASVLNTSIDNIEKVYHKVVKGFEQLKENDLIIKIDQDNYPTLLAKTEDAPRFLFARGNISLAQMNAISIVGTRNPSPEGQKKAYVLASLLGKYNIVVASGLASGIDTSAHQGAINSNTPTIAVIGTPLTRTYPRENAKLQEDIAEKGLIISQFAPSSPIQRWNFPMRNYVMSGLSLATVIIEAGETSGALIQANYALKQERFVFIPQSALDNQNLRWPKNYIKREGAYSFSRIDELIQKLQNSKIISSSTKKNDQPSLNLDLHEVGNNNVYVSQ